VTAPIRTKEEEGREKARVGVVVKGEVFERKKKWRRKKKPPQPQINKLVENVWQHQRARRRKPNVAKK
jgi:hypothetical protein